MYYGSKELHVYLNNAYYGLFKKYLFTVPDEIQIALASPINIFPNSISTDIHSKLDNEWGKR